ncbi:hypothetical protein [Lysobacter gummosus]|uniref:hypothetical protein n=1 Tax=Lysobacter gummosus TaxID=262324 RepID=UPI003632EED8
MDIMIFPLEAADPFGARCIGYSFARALHSSAAAVLRASSSGAYLSTPAEPRFANRSTGDSIRPRSAQPMPPLIPITCPLM